MISRFKFSNSTGGGSSTRSIHSISIVRFLLLVMIVLLLILWIPSSSAFALPPPPLSPLSSLSLLSSSNSQNHPTLLANPLSLSSSGYYNDNSIRRSSLSQSLEHLPGTRRQSLLIRSGSGQKSPLSPRRRQGQNLFVLKAVRDDDEEEEKEEFDDDDEQSSTIGGSAGNNLLAKARAKFLARPGTYLVIPIIAALVGWFTNYLAVQMIFYPVEFWGVPIYRRPEIPLGLLGWQGIVPCKTKTMSTALVEMVTSQLLTVQEAFSRLDPSTVAKLLAPEIPSLGQEVLTDMNVVKGVPMAVWNFVTRHTTALFNVVNVHFLTGLVQDMINQCTSIFSLKDCVVDQMMLDRAKLGQLFQKVGQKELDFLTNSGLWFGFLLGLIQMAVALVWDNPWSLSIGGMIVGLATNWLALKWIFEPIYPTRLGIGPFKLPFVIQGMFLRRQKEVAAEFSKFFAENVVNSANIWTSMLSDPSTTPNMISIISNRVGGLLNVMTLGIFGRLASSDSIVSKISQSIVHRLTDHVHVLHTYVDKALGLEATLRVKMEAMSPDKFERVLHPIFEQDELTLIIAGGILGLAAGLIQQGIETGAISIPNPFPTVYRYCRTCLQYFKAKLKGSGTDTATDNEST
mmetsp:Transcript_60881/g.149074  ORF Transcript_60881/g.149074 Transcript_60881/m.149074 type:complete len:627 (+) Transcript_60881:76-1956(+)